MRAKAIILFTVLTTACQQDLKIEILHQQQLNVPSTSGVVRSGNNYFAIGDNSPFLFTLDEDFNVVSKSPIHSFENLDGDTIAKIHKPDFEAMEMISESEIIVFGSGSKSPQRDKFLMITLGDTISVKEYNIASFYENLKGLPILDNQELNIEAVAFREGYLYLFNRGRNVVFTFEYRELLKFFEGAISFPTPEVTLFKLPSINGIEAGFSGATAFTGSPRLLFTASIENTPNAYDDGEVLGSFIGVIDITNNTVASAYRSVGIPDPSLKVESVVIHKEISNQATNIVLVTDSDGGKSMVLKARLEL